MQFQDEKFQDGPGQGSSAITERVELHIGCRNLKKMDFASESDPFVVVYERKKGNFVQVFKTEVLDNKPDPNFETTFTLDYFFEKEQLLKFDVYDSDDPNINDLSKHDFLGGCTMTLGEIVHAENGVMSAPLLINGKRAKNSQKKYSSLIVRADKAVISKNKYRLKFRGTNLPKMDFWGRIDAFFRICRVEDTEHKQYRLDKWKDRILGSPYKSEYISSNYTPNWRSFEITEHQLYYENKSKQFEVQIYDWNSNGNHDFVGSVFLTHNDLLNVLNEGKLSSFDIELINQKLQKKCPNNKQKPKLIVEKVENLPTFYDFLSGGCDFSLMVALDYTGSNLDTGAAVAIQGQLLKPDVDLHRIYKAPNDFTPSQYQMAIRKIGNILQSYDSDQMYPLWGFGLWGRFADNPQITTTRHGFNVNTQLLGYQEDEVSGIYGLEKCYEQSINLVRQNIGRNPQSCALSGPTYFSNILANAKQVAEEAFNDYKQGKSKLQYFIFLIITDGAVSREDMLKTINQIVDIATKGLPMSILIVGVGNGPFDSMNLLDGDFLGEIDEIKNNPKIKNNKKEDLIFKLLQESGYRQEYISAIRKCGKRDIVDFIELNEFNSMTLLDKNGKSLENKTLEEIPSHFVRFVEFNKIPIPEKQEFKQQDFGNERQNYFNRQASQSQSVMYPELNDYNEPNQQYQQQDMFYNDAPLPPQWERAYTQDGKLYYVNHKSHLTQWVHPDDPTSPQNRLKNMAKQKSNQSYATAPYAN